LPERSLVVQNALMDRTHWDRFATAPATFFVCTLLQ
jgi:hypothetical protein